MEWFEWVVRVGVVVVDVGCGVVGVVEDVDCVGGFDFFGVGWIGDIGLVVV